ncbi:MAG: hypothetical protein KAR21_01875 [Spirochaetales bacterium]|nr:hypothetical protein [Spirochaetales bacterium]
MWQDPIVKETRELRELYAAKFKHDLDAIFKDICNRQEKSERKSVSFPARKPKLKQNIA